MPRYIYRDTPVQVLLQKNGNFRKVMGDTPMIQKSMGVTEKNGLNIYATLSIHGWH